MEHPGARPPRLQRVLAHAGLGSRHACERLIADGRVRVDGALVTDLGHRVDPSRAVIEVDGRRIEPSPQGGVYLALHKPPGVVATMRDERGRPCLTSLLGGERPGLFHVGRIDAESAGLVLLTNDGELGHGLAAPGLRLPHTYLAALHGVIDPGTAAGLLRDHGPVGPTPHVLGLRVVAAGGGRSLVEVVLAEGQAAALRRLLASVGHPVDHLVHTGVGPVALGDLPSGATRPLTEEELAELRQIAGGVTPEPPAGA